MGLGGFKKVKKLTREMKENREHMNAKFTPNFSLGSGETATVFFNGDLDSEPKIVQEHSVRQGGNFFSMICSKGSKFKCVACYKQQRNDKSIGYASNKAVMNVADLRMVHKIKDKERSTADREKFKYLPCTLEDGECKRCSRGLEPIPAGQKKWTMSMTWAQALTDSSERLSKKCFTCGSKTKVLGFRDMKNGERTSEVEEGREEDFEKILKCPKCKKCIPHSLANTAIDITKTGEKMSTSYQFTPNYDVDVSEFKEREDLKPIDLDAACAPDTSQRQADRLRCANPFEKDRESDSDEEDATEYDADEDETDGEELFKPKSGKSSKKSPVKKKKNPLEDDDEEEESDDDEEADEDDED